MSRKPKDWRHAHQVMLRQEIEDMQQAREEGSCKRVYIPGLQRTRMVCNLTDSEIYEIAKFTVTRDSERAINQWNAAEMRRRYRSSEAA